MRPPGWTARCYFYRTNYFSFSPSSFLCVAMPSSDSNSEPIAHPETGVSAGWLLALGLAVLPFLLLAYYNYPSIHDDYLNAHYIAQYGRIGYVRHMYNAWSGRYTELVLKAFLNPLSYQQTAWLSRLQPVVVIGLVMLGAYTLFRVLLRGAAASVVAAGALLLTVLYLNGFGTVGASFYWFGGYTAYTAGAVASLFAFAGLVGTVDDRGPAGVRRRWGAVAAGFSLLAIGTYEVSMLAIGGVVGSLTAWAWLRNQSAKSRLVAVGLLVLLGCCAAVAAPGNRVRAITPGHFPHHVLTVSWAAQSGWLSLRLAFKQCLSWAVSPLLLLGSLLLAGLLWRARAALPLDLARLPLVGLAAGLLGGVTVLIFPSVLLLGVVQGQSLQGIYFYFLLGWLSWMAVAFARFASKIRLLSELSQPAAWHHVALIFWMLCLYSETSNTHLAYVELFTTAGPHYRRMRQREQRLRAAAVRHAASIEIIPLYSASEADLMPKILYPIDFNASDAAQYARYYGLDSTRVRVPVGTQ